MRRFARVLPLGLVAVMLSTPSATPVAVAAPVVVQMSASAYLPATVTVPLGGQIRWWNTSGTSHTATSKQGFFQTPLLSAGGGEAFVSFEHAGSYGYYCEVHGLGMSGTVKVPLRAPTGAANGFTLRWSAAGSFISGRRFDVQKMAPGTSTWTWLKSNTTTRSVFLNPAKNGTWRFRAKTENTGNLSNIMTSGWSPTKTVRVS